jgi:uncharacterized protein YbjT (DUF2867 family)
MTYAVLGVTGNTGRVVAETLLDAGRAVRVVVRERSKAAAFEARGADVAVADLQDKAALTRAFTGVDGAYALIPPSFAPEFSAYQHATADVIRQAAKDSNLAHLVLLSSIGAQHAAGNGPIAGIHYAEQHLSNLPSTRFSFLRAAYFMENFSTSLGLLDQGILPSFLPAAFEFNMVAARDIGAAAASLLLEGTAKTQVIDIAGQRASFGKAADILSRLVGKPIAVREAPLDAVVPTMKSFGMPTELAGLYRELFEGMLSGHVAYESGFRRAQAPTTLDTVLAKLLGLND